MTEMTDWDDLRFFLAVARTGTLAAASKLLHVDHATVSRRIRAIESRVGARLFDRVPGAWTPSEAGARMREVAERVEQEVHSLGRSVAGSDARIEGKLRIAVSDVAAYALLDELTAFSALHPGIELEITASNRPSNLTRREADVAVRATATPPEHLVGRKLGSTALSAYAAPDLAVPVRAAEEMAALPWIGWDESLDATGASRWMRTHLAGARIVARFDSLLLAFFAARRGIGAALLPCILGDREPGLRRVVPDLVLPGPPLWVVTHADLRAAARVRRFLDFLPEAVARQRDLLEGRRPEAWRAAPAGARPSRRAAAG